MDNKPLLFQEIIVSLLIGISLIFITNHFGKFSYSYLEGGKPQDVIVRKINYKTPLGTEVETNNDGYTMLDVLYKDFASDYYPRVTYYLKSSLKETPYIILLSGLIFLIFFRLRKFDLNLDDNEVNITKIENKIITIKQSPQYKKLKRLYNSNILTQEEFDERVEQIQKNYFEQAYINSQEFNELQQLYEEGYFDEKTFKTKSEILKNKIVTNSIEKEDENVMKQEELRINKDYQEKNISRFYGAVIILMFLALGLLKYWQTIVTSRDFIALYSIVFFLIAITILFSTLHKKFFLVYLLFLVPLITTGIYLFDY